MRTGYLILAATLGAPACAHNQTPAPAPAPARASAAPAAACPAIPACTAPRAEQDRRIARLELRLLEKEAQVDALQARLDESRQEVVRAMAKLQTLASRAEAASGIAEAEVALQPLTAGAGSPPPEVAQGTKLLKESSAEFDKQNYGGALYLANQAKSVAAGARGRLASGDRGAERPGEAAFALPVPLKATSAGNVRQGPGTNTAVAFGVRPGDQLTGYSYVDEWIRIGDDQGRGGWIFRGLVTRR
jgi:uncharacterized coiled-coil protein SlyX